MKKAIRQEFLVSHLIILTLLAMHSKAVAQESDETHVPELVAISWGLDSDTTSLDEVKFRDAEGEEIDGLTHKEIAMAVAPQQLVPRIDADDEDYLPGLALIFRVDNQLQKSGIAPYLNMETENPMPSIDWREPGDSEFAVAFLIPPADKFEEWPESAELTIRYLTQLPDTNKVEEDVHLRQELLEGVWCDPKPDGTGKYAFGFERPMMRVEPNQPREFHDFAITLQDGDELAPCIVEIRVRGGLEWLCMSTKPIQPDSVKSISVTRSVYAYQSIGKIRIPKDLLVDP